MISETNYLVGSRRKNAMRVLFGTATLVLSLVMVTTALAQTTAEDALKQKNIIKVGS